MERKTVIVTIQGIPPGIFGNSVIWGTDKLNRIRRSIQHYISEQDTEMLYGDILVYFPLEMVDKDVGQPIIARIEINGLEIDGKSASNIIGGMIRREFHKTPILCSFESQNVLKKLYPFPIEAPAEEGNRDFNLSACNCCGGKRKMVRGSVNEVFCTNCAARTVLCMT